MRKLSNLEISNISGAGAGDKRVLDLTPNEVLTYLAAAGAAKWLWDAAATWASSGGPDAAWGANAVFATSSVGGAVGLVGGWFASKLVAEHVAPFM